VDFKKAMMRLLQLDKQKIVEKEDINMPDCAVSILSWKAKERRELIKKIRRNRYDLKTSLGFPEEVTFGIEIEFVRASRARVDEVIERQKGKGELSDGWKVVDERTVNHGKYLELGGEVVSPILTDDPNSWVEIEKICELLKKYNAGINEKCGGHIHFGYQILGLSTNAWKRMFQMWRAYEDVLYKFSAGDMCMPRKAVYSYAKPIAHELRTNYNKRKDGYGEGLSGLSKLIADYINECDGAVGLNLYNINPSQNLQNIANEKKTTIELRCPNSSINAQTWQNNIKTFGLMLLACRSLTAKQEKVLKRRLLEMPKSESRPEEYYKINLEKAFEFCDIVFEDEGDKIDFLTQYLRTDQEIDLLGVEFRGEGEEHGE